MIRQHHPGGPGAGIQAPGRIHVEQRRHQAEPQKFLFLAGIQPAEHQNRTHHSRLAQRNAFLDDSHPEHPRADILERGRDVGGAVSVGIGLDHRQNPLFGAGQGLRLAKIVFQSLKIDFNAGGPVSPGITHDVLVLNLRDMRPHNGRKSDNVKSRRGRCKKRTAHVSEPNS